MGYYLQVGTSEPSPLASNGGYADFVKWVGGLPAKEFGEMRHLCDHGWCQELADLSSQVAAAVKVRGPADTSVRETAVGLLDLLDDVGGATVCTVTDGLGSDDGGGETRYSPDQPRGPDGKWGEGGGADSGEKGTDDAKPSGAIGAGHGVDHGNPDDHPREEGIRRQILGLPTREHEAALKAERAGIMELHAQYKAGDKAVAGSLRDRAAAYNAKIVEAKAATELSRGEAYKAIGVPIGLHVTAGVSGAELEHNGLAVDRAKAFIGRAVADHVGVREVEVRVEADRARAVASGKPGDALIMAGPGIRGETVVHEFGHVIETNSESHFRAAVDFLERRTGGNPVAKMADLTGNKGYRDNEVGRDDKFSDPYTGKVYAATGPYTYKGVRATEVTSMGMERMMKDPVGFAKQDPDHFRFTLAQMSRPATPREK